AQDGAPGLRRGNSPRNSTGMAPGASMDRTGARKRSRLRCRAGSGETDGGRCPGAGAGGALRFHESARDQARAQTCDPAREARLTEVLEIPKTRATVDRVA